jgi:hypothetical protein
MPLQLWLFMIGGISTTISCFYIDKKNWALASKEKVDELAMLNDGGAIDIIGENDISMDIP